MLGRWQRAWRSEWEGQARRFDTRPHLDQIRASVQPADKQAERAEHSDLRAAVSHAEQR